MSKTSKGQKFMSRCWQKKRFASVADAMAKAREIGSPMLGAYQCTFCKSWHIGTWRNCYPVPLCHDAEDY